MEEIFDRQQPDFQKASDADPKSGLPSIIDFVSFKKTGHTDTAITERFYGTVKQEEI